MKIDLLLHNIRSIHNVGSIMRTADGLGVNQVVFSGYTPRPRQVGDTRLPYQIERAEKLLHKTALGAEKSVNSCETSDPLAEIELYKKQGWLIAGLEQAANSQILTDFKPNNQPVLLILGEEVDGINPEILAACDVILEIPMVGQKESFNVSVAAAITLFYLQQVI